MTTDLLNRPLRDLRISVIDACNFRCTYCMPAERFPANYPFLEAAKLLSFDEIVSVARVAADLGVKKIKLTGGEPLVRPFLPSLVQKLKQAVPTVEIGLITNGLHLQPLLSRFKEAGLDSVTVSLDSLDPAVFGTITGRGYRVEQIVQAIEAASQIGFNPVKVNMVAIRGVNDGQIEDMAAFFRRPGFILRFIEYMDVGTLNGWKRSDVVTSAEILSRLSARWPLQAREPNHAGETATRYSYKDVDTEVGFISSVSQPFCGDCSRLRLSADGKLHTCLFSKKGTDVQALLRSGGTEDDLRSVLTSLWAGRSDRYSAQRAEAGNLPDVVLAGPVDEKKIEMFAIGG